MANNKILFSIVICTYNGAKKIEPAIKSILSQNYPKGQYEVIVVDDGSTDNTVNVVSKYPVELIRNKKNLGIAASRNVGLAHSRGEILVCFDDDCVADSNWLSQLGHGYLKPDVMGVSGYIVRSPVMTLTDNYCLDSGYGNPTPLLFGMGNTIFRRFYNYVISFFTNPQGNYRDGDEVLQFPGLSASFRKECLIENDGWDNAYKYGAEDDDVCNRLKTAYPNYKFVVMRSAVIYHAQQLTFMAYLHKEYLRGMNRRVFYASMGKTLPYFPFPFACMLLSILTVYTNMFYLLPLIPFLVYPWWIYRTFSEGNMRFILYPYLQLSYEASVVLGMLMVKV